MATVLEREVFSEAEAARLLQVAQSTLHYWLEGGERRGRTYQPVIRLEPKGNRAVTWAEFVEAALLRECRSHQVPMVELRSFIGELRQRFGVPYPLTDRRVADKQPMLTPASDAFVQRIDWDGDLASGWRPDANEGSPVRIRPDVRFGRPAIKGISTEVLWEQHDAGDDVASIAEVYGLTVADVRWALAYEDSLRAA